jgi:dephospho-CoA kinase
MLHVALTGNVASGKSTVAELFREWGATIIDADRLVREAQQPGSDTLARIAERFGPGVLTDTGELDRDAVRDLVFTDAAARRDLEAIVHPAVWRRRDALLEEARARGDRVVVSDIPLLFEVADAGRFPLESLDAIVLVDAPADVRRARLVELRGIEPAEADRMIAAQLPSERKRNRATWVIDNDADLATLVRRARHVWDALADRAHGA